MIDDFPPLQELSRLPRRVLCIAPHPDDEVLGCGGMLALHAARHDDVRVVVLAGEGSARANASIGPCVNPLPSHASPPPAPLSLRESESAAAAHDLGYSDLRFLGFSDGQLGASTTLVAELKAELEAFSPDLVYAPSPFEHHPDHKACHRALAAALAGSRPCRVHLYGVNTAVPANVLFDITSVAAKKRAALERFASQRALNDIVGKSLAADRARTMNVDDASVQCTEGFISLASDALREFLSSADALLDRMSSSSAPFASGISLPKTTAVVSTWNKRADLRANLDGLRSQTLPFAAIIVVDNASRDGTADMIARDYPEVRLIVMPHSRYGACETFNIGFSSSTTELTAILDDDIVMPPEWLEKATQRMLHEPASTAILSTQVIEPDMPESYMHSPLVNQERYMSTFRGCASLARTQALREAGGYDERLFIYGNERDLTCRLFNLGYRVLQYPGCGVFHKTPFGIKMGKRSLYFHARNAWLSMLKYAPLSALLKMPFLVFTRVVLRGPRKEAEGSVTDATGTIGIGRSLAETPGAWWVVTKAALSVILNVPYCLKRRAPVRHPDFELPLH